MDKRERHIAALERMGYTCYHETWWDGEVDGYVVRDPKGELPCYHEQFPEDLQREAWDEFLKLIGKA